MNPNINNKAPYFIGIITVLISVGVVLAQHSSKNSTTIPEYPPAGTVAPNVVVAPTAPTPKTNPTPSPTTYTLATIAIHNTQSDCWTTINGSVYNVTSWISQHPGGAEAIISLCGTDGSTAFNGQHGGQRRPANELASFKIGILK